MRETRIPIGSLVAAIGGVLLIVSLGLDWYGPFSAFTTFEVWDLVLLVLAIVAIASLAVALGLLPTRFRAGTDLVVGAAALLIVLSQLINHPPVGLHRDEGTGLWLGLAGSALMLVGAILSTARIAISVEPRGRGAGVTTGGPTPDEPARPAAGAPARPAPGGPARPAPGGSPRPAPGGPPRPAPSGPPPPPPDEEPTIRADSPPRP